MFRYAWSLPILALSCSSPTKTEPQITPPDSVELVAAWTLDVDPGAQQAQFNNAFGQSFSGLVQTGRVVRDNTAGSGPANTWELVTTNAMFAGQGRCGLMQNCFDVDVRSFEAITSYETFLVINLILPPTGRSLVGPDLPPYNATTMRSPWGFRQIGTVPGAGGVASIQLDFNVPDATPYQISGELYRRATFGADAVFTNASGTNIACTNNGSGGFTCADVSTDANSTQRAAIADVDNDGDGDIIFANGDTNNRLCFNNGSGSYTCGDLPSILNATNREIVPVDMDGDNDIDLIFAIAGNPNTLCTNTDGAGTYTCADLTTASNQSFGIAVGDLDGDTDLDVLFANNGANRVCVNNGGTFTCSDIAATVFTSYAVALGDLDGDGDLDAAFSSYGGTNELCLNAGNATFTCSNFNARTDLSNAVAMGDLDDDGDIDVVFTTLNTPGNTSPDRLCVNNGSAVFVCQDVSADYGASRAIRIADADGDGDLDIYNSNSFSETDELCTNNGGLSFTCATIQPANTVAYGMAIGQL